MDEEITISAGETATISCAYCMIEFAITHHPEADGKDPQDGDLEFEINFKLEEEATLYVDLGLEDVLVIHDLLSQAVADTISDHPDKVAEAKEKLDSEKD